MVAEELPRLHAPGAGDRDHLAGRRRFACRSQIAIHEVVHVHRRDQAAAARGQDQLAAPDRLEREDHPGPRCRPVDVARPDHRARQLPGRVGLQHQLLTGDLGVGVGPAGPTDWCALVHLAGGLVPEHDDRRCVHEEGRAAAHGGVERVPGAGHVDPPEVLVAAAEADDRREVEHQVAALGVRLPVARLGHVAGHHSELGVRPHVHVPHLGPLRRVAGGENAAYEAQRAGDEDPARCVSHR